MKASLLSEYQETEDVLVNIIELESEATRVRATRICAQYLIGLKEIESQLSQDVTVTVLYTLHRRLSDISARIGASADLDSVHKIKLLDRAQAHLVETTNRIDTRSKERLRALVTQRANETKPQSSHDSEGWSSAIRDCLKLYELEPILPDIINVFEVLMEPFQSRFKYHFASNRPTNRLDKPEWPLQHVLALIEKEQDFVLAVFQPLLNECLPNTKLYAPHELIRSSLALIRTHMASNVANVLDDSPLLDHIMEECKKFDDTLRADYDFRNRDFSRWPGLVDDVCTPQVLTSWLSHSDAFVKSRYHAIIDDEDAFEIKKVVETSNYDVAPNASSLRIIDLFEAMTKRSTPLEGLDHHQTFISSVQVPLLDSYLEKIRASTDAFDELVNGFSGGFPSADITGLNGLKRLCRQISGVSNVLLKIKDLSNDPFFIDNSSSEEDQSCFQRQIDEYSNHETRIQGLITLQIERELVQDLRSYFRLQTWSSDEAPQAGIATSSMSSPQLIHFYGTINNLLQYLKSVTSPLFLHKIYINVANNLDRVLWTKIVSKTKFARRGALQFKRDIYQMWATFSPYVIQPEQGMRMMSDVLLIFDCALTGEKKGNEKFVAIKSASNEKELHLVGITTLSEVDVQLIVNRLLFD